MEKPEKKINLYPALILLLLGIFIPFLAWSAFQAAGLGSRVTDVDYYSKGLKYNSTQVEKRAAEVLGWKLDTRLEGRALSLQLSGKNGAPVAGARGSLYLAIPGEAENMHFPLHESSPGLYRILFTETISGTIQAQLEMERGGARLYRQLLLNL